MASAQFLKEASTDADGRVVNATVATLENQLITSVPSVSCQNKVVNILHHGYSSLASNASFVISENKYITGDVKCSLVGSNLFSPAVSYSSASYNNVCTSTTNNYSSLSVTRTLPGCSDNFQVTNTQAQNVSNSNFLTFHGHSLPSACVGLTSHIISSVVSPDSAAAMQTQVLFKQGTTSGHVGIQPGMVTVPMTVSSSMATSIPNVMTLNKPGGPNVVVTTQNLGSAQPAIIPNVQILNMRPGAPPVAAQKSVAAVSPRVVIGAPQVVGARAAAPGITLQTLQSLQPGQQGHLLLKTENGQYQLLRVGPAPTASTLTAPQPQTIRLSTVPTHPGVATVSTSMAPGPIPGQMPPAPVATPVVASVNNNMASITPPPQPPTVTTVKPSDNTKEKCRNFLANLLDLSSKEPPSVERNVRNLIQELIDAQVEPEEFCDRLERLLNASPQPCLIGFLKKSLPLLRQSMVTKELVIEGINPPAPHIAFSSLPAPVQPVMAPTNMQMLSDDEGSSPTLTPLLPPVMPLALAQSLMPNSKPLGILPVQPTPSMQLSDDEDGSSPTLTPLLPPVMPLPLVPSLVPNSMPNTAMSMQLLNSSQKPAPKPNNAIAVLQNIPVHSKINVGKMNGGKSMTVNSKANFPRPGGSASTLSTVLTPGKSLLKDKEKKTSSQFSSQPFGDDKMAGDDDINDVAAMGGVNLAEESQRILGSTEMIGTQIRSCREEYLVSLNVIQARVKAAAARHNLEEPSAEVAGLISHAVHERLKNLVEKLAVVAQYRIDLIKTDARYDVGQDVKGQLKFLEELDRVDKKRREDSEREMLLRAAKSRSKNEDPEQAKLKAKAKEMQRAELEELRQREANLTALQAIGPRKKPRLDGPSAAGDSITNSTVHNNVPFSGRSQLALRTRLKRINYRDMVCLLEQEQDTSHSLMLYKSYLK